MIACLRSSRFMYPQNRAEPVFLDLRRFHNLDNPPGGKKGKKFVVSKRVLAAKTTINKGFDTLNEARTHWCVEAMRLEDMGMQKMDFTISGFHEED